MPEETPGPSPNDQMSSPDQASIRTEAFHHSPPVCVNGHENAAGSAFCSTCGSPLGPIRPEFTAPADPNEQAAAAGPEAVVNDPAAASTPPQSWRSVRKMNWKLVIPIAAVVVIGLIFGGVTLSHELAAREAARLAAIAAQERDTAWNTAVDAARKGMGAKVHDERSVSFTSARKTDCDADDYQKYDYWLGTVTDWDALEVCRSAADLVFSASVTATMTTIDGFTQALGLPAAFGERLKGTRGLDGTQESTFEDTKVGTVHVTYSYDGGNGLFVQFERK